MTFHVILNLLKVDTCALSFQIMKHWSFSLLTFSNFLENDMFLDFLLALQLLKEPKCSSKIRTNLRKVEMWNTYPFADTFDSSLLRQFFYLFQLQTSLVSLLMYCATLFVVVEFKSHNKYLWELITFKNCSIIIVC